MNVTIWQTVSVLIGLVVVAVALSYVTNTIFSSDMQCKDACSFDGYRCDDDISEVCLDNNQDMCKEYSAERCTLGCDEPSGVCRKGP